MTVERNTTLAPTIGSACVSGLERLSQALGLRHEKEVLASLIADALGPEGEVPIGSSPAPTDLSDDGSPFEYSVSINNGRPELRFLIEAQGRPASLESNWRAALATNARLAERWGASLDRFNQIADLFAPRNQAATLAIWHAVCLRTGTEPLVKVYLDPAAAGPTTTRQTVASALSELGMEATWPQIADLLDSEQNSELTFFSLDLSAAPDARVKIYVSHPCATAEEFARVLESDGSRTYLRAIDLCRILTGGTGPYAQRPLISCWGFTSSNPGTPRQVTAHVPVRSYAWDDAVAAKRLLAYLPPGASDTAKRAIESVARRPLAAGRGLIAYVSMREDDETQHFTIYLSAEAYAVTPPIGPTRSVG